MATLCEVFVAMIAISVVHAALPTHVDTVPRSSRVWFSNISHCKYSLTLYDMRRIYLAWKYRPLPVNNAGVKCCRFIDS